MFQKLNIAFMSLFYLCKWKLIYFPQNNLHRVRVKRWKMNQREECVFGLVLCEAHRKLVKNGCFVSLKEDKHLLSLLSRSIVSWFSSNWSLSRLAAIKPFLASWSCKLSCWISFFNFSCCWWSAWISRWSDVVRMSISRSLSVWC